MDGQMDIDRGKEDGWIDGYRQREGLMDGQMYTVQIKMYRVGERIDEQKYSMTIDYDGIKRKITILLN